jgi:cytochrome c-type biogenesis protein CcsB
MNTTWAYASNNFVYAAMALFTLSFLSHAFETAFAVRAPKNSDATDGNLLTKTLDYTRTEKAARLATAFMALGTNGHVPWGNMYEFSITGAFAFSLAYLAALRKYDLRWLGLFITFGVLLTLGTAVTLLYRDSAPLVPALKSPWLIIHVSTAIICGGIFLLANIIAGAYLYLERYEEMGARPAWALRIPSLETLDQLSYRLVAFVFPLWTFSVIAGAIWAESAWGRYWGWDPKETWAFITWVAYAAYLHARVTIGWRGRRAAWLCIFAGSTFLFNYVYVNVWGTGKHTYSGLE